MPVVAAFSEPAIAAVVAYVATALVFAAGIGRARALAKRKGPRAVANRAPPSIAAPARIAFLGDVQRGVREVAGPVVAALRDEGASLLVSSGDLSSHGEAPYHGVVGAAFDRAGLATPMLVAPGNHDVEPSGHGGAAEGRALFEEQFGPRRFSLRVGPLLLVGIDDAADPVDADLFDWLEEIVGAHAGPWLLVAHRPPRKLLREGAPVVVGLDPLLALFARRPPVAVVSGHLERDQEAVLDGVRYVVNAEGGDVAGGAWRAPATFRLMLADVDATGTPTFRRVDLARRLSWRTALDQLAVRLWVEGRRFPGIVFAAPARLLLRRS